MDVSALGSTPKVGDVRVANVFCSLQYDLLFSGIIIRRKKKRSEGLFSTEDIFSCRYFFNSFSMILQLWWVLRDLWRLANRICHASYAAKGWEHI